MGDCHDQNPYDPLCVYFPRLCQGKWQGTELGEHYVSQQSNLSRRMMPYGSITKRTRVRAEAKPDRSRAAGFPASAQHGPL